MTTGTPIVVGRNTTTPVVQVESPAKPRRGKIKGVRPDTPAKALEDFRANLMFCRTDEERRVMDSIIADMEKQVTPEVLVHTLFQQTGMVQRAKRSRSGYIGVTLIRKIKSTGETPAG